MPSEPHDEEPDEHEIDILLTARRDEIFAYEQTLKKFRPIATREEFDELHKRYAQTDDQRLSRKARDAIIYGNFRLVAYWALIYRRPGVPLPELMQEGFLGMERALVKFEAERGLRFSTYASQWIRSAMQRYFINNLGWHISRVPVYAAVRKNLLKRAIENYLKEHGCKPNDYELWQYVKTLDSKLAKKMKLHDVVELRRQMRESIVKLDAKLVSSEKDSAAFGELIADSRVSIEDTVAAKEMLELYLKVVERVSAELDRTSPRNKAIILERLGLNGEKPTLESLGAQSDITRERVRQIESKELHRLSYRTKISIGELRRLAKTIEELERIICAGR